MDIQPKMLSSWKEVQNGLEKNIIIMHDTVWSMLDLYRFVFFEFWNLDDLDVKSLLQ